MKCRKTFRAIFVLALLAISAYSQDRLTGGIKGKVHVVTGTPGGVAVVVRRGDDEVTRATTDRNGEFSVQRLPPGVYALTFRKTGLSVGTVEGVEVKSGKTRTLSDRLYLTIDEGSIAFIKGSVFTESGRSFPNVRVELAHILEDGSLKKIDGRVTGETGEFNFRLNPDAGKYRITAKADRMQPATKDVDVDGAAVYRVAISLTPAPK